MKTMEQKIAFVNGVNFSELFRNIEVSTGMVLTFSEIEIKNIRGEAIISCFSQDICENCGIFGKILTRCVVKVSGRVYGGYEGDEELSIGLRADLEYERTYGGENGMTLLSAQYENGSWKCSNTLGR